MIKILFSVIVTLAVLAPINGAYATLPKALQTAIAESKIPLDEISLWVAPVNSGNAVVEWQAQRPRTPASTMKVITTGAGLALLGAQYRWQTRFYLDGELGGDGVLHGNLIIKGEGNPYLVQEDMAAMVAELRRRGLSRIEGKIILDSSYFLSSREHPAAFDGHGLEPYNAIPHALSINFRTIDLFFKPEKSRVNVGVELPLARTRIDNSMRLNSAKRCRGKGFAPRIEVDYAQDIITVSGQMSKKCPQKRLTKVLTGAGDLFFSHFKKAWIKAGGRLSGSWVYGTVPDSSALFYVFYSQPLSEQIAAMNKKSNNLMTRQLFLTIGAEITQPPATLQKSRAVIMNFLNEKGINTGKLFIDNGSGLSRTSRISAEQLGRFLLYVYRDKRIRDDFMRSLSIAGVDGTLRKRMKNTPLAGNARGKTGTLKRAKSLAGYLTAEDGNVYVYVMLFEGKRARSGRALMDGILLWLYSYPNSAQ